ncbi:cupin domain-containing protein [Kineosporia sp. R_H_3]|uniref:cupin domain-containing protein n=1 Tax=Kineosporia sp. R_H_3 TaxID=1961848 RepID=UPI000B4B6EBE|nr:cupin domain-containing protein [Kineosporia sp. R_H_3]
MDVRPLVRHEDDVPLERWDDPVRGRLGFRTAFSGDVTATVGLTTGVAVLRPGEWLGRHRHTPPEVYFVAEGTGTVSLDGVEHTLRPGSSVYVPGDAEHGIVNDGSGLLRFFYVFPTDSFEDFDYRF